MLYTDHHNGRFGRDMLGFTLGLPVRPHAYLVGFNHDIVNIRKLLLMIMLFRTVEGR